MNEPREDNQTQQSSEKSKSSKWWIYVKPCICLFNLRIEENFSKFRVYTLKKIGLQQFKKHKKMILERHFTRFYD